MRRILFALAFLFSLAHVAEATTYYVAKTGVDPPSRSCSTATSSATPLLTINAGAGCLASGDTLLVRTGTYVESLVSRNIASGSAGAYTKIHAYPGGPCTPAVCEVVTMKPAAGPSAVIYTTSESYVEFDGINLDSTNATTSNRMGGFWANYSSTTTYSHHLRFQYADVLMNNLAGDLFTSLDGLNSIGPDAATGGSNEFRHLTVHGGGGTNGNLGFYFHNSNNILEDSEIYDMGQFGGQIYNFPTTPTGNIIRRNKIHDITQSMDGRRCGVVLIGSSTQIYNNWIWNIDGGDTTITCAISVEGSNNVVANNTAWSNDGSFLNLGPTNTTLVANNLTYQHGQNDGITSYGTNTNLTQQTNVFGTVNPVFSNAAAGNLHLTASSPASIVNAGTTLTQFSTDIDSDTRPQGAIWDIGADEFASGSVPQSPPPTTETQKYRVRFRKP